MFITGGTGLLGSHLTRYLVGAGAEVVALVRDQVPRSLFFDPSWGLQNQVTVVHGQIEDYAVLERSLNEYEIDTVFHLAAQTIVGTANRGPLSTFKANIEGTWNLLEAARQQKKTVQRVIIASSDKAYGNLKGAAYDEDMPLRGEHPYDVSKSCGDLLAQAYYTSYGLPVAITRCGNFFGAGDLNASRLIPGTISAVLNNERPVIRSNGAYIRDYIFVEDGVHAYITLAEALLDDSGAPRFAGHAFNFSYGLKLSVLQVVEKILALMQSKLQPQVKNEATNEIPEQRLDSTKARNLLQWKPRYGFEEGLQLTIDWYRKISAQGSR